MSQPKLSPLQECLRFGDIVVLAEVSTSSFVRSEPGYTEGLIVDQLIPALVDHERSAHNVHECIFEIQPRRFYNEGGGKFISPLDGTALALNDSESHRDSERRAEEEKAANDRFYDEMKGRQLVYGDVIQLRNVWAGKYVTTTRLGSKLHRMSMAIQLDEVGDAGSCFVVMPEAKIHLPGDPVLDRAEVCLMSMQFSHIYLNINTLQPMLDKEIQSHKILLPHPYVAKRFEVNASSDRASFMMKRFKAVAVPSTLSWSSGAPPTLREEEADLVSGADMVSFYHRQSNSVLVVDSIGDSTMAYFMPLEGIQAIPGAKAIFQVRAPSHARARERDRTHVQANTHTHKV